MLVRGHWVPPTELKHLNPPAERFEEMPSAGSWGDTSQLGTLKDILAVGCKVVVFPLPRFTMTTCFMRSFLLHYLEALILKYDNLLMVSIAKFWE